MRLQPPANVGREQRAVVPIKVVSLRGSLAAAKAGASPVLVNRQAERNSVTQASAATQEKLRNSPELLCNLAFGVCDLRLPQFDRISLGVMQAGEPAVGIRLRVNLHLDSRRL